MQIAIVILILSLTLYFTARWIYRQTKGDADCGCGCSQCPMNGSRQCHCHDKNNFFDTQTPQN